jgi:phytoene dehydrogenase-like protein
MPCGTRSLGPVAALTLPPSTRSLTGFASSIEWRCRNFIDLNYNSPLGLLSSPRAVAQLVRLGACGRLGAAVRKRFADPRVHRLFNFQAVYAGLAPDSALRSTQ